MAFGCVTMLLVISIFAHYVLLTMGFLPEEDMSAPEIIAYYGYPVEIISVTTPDGYILQMHRIPCGVNDSLTPQSPRRPVVFLQHGLLASSCDWITNLPNESMAFLLADAGFDVWLGNTRGNFYSQRHKSLSPSSKEFWQFSWDEMSALDLDTMINRVLNMTDHDDLYYIGHSQGTLIMFGKLAKDPKFHKKIKKFFALAPVASVKHIKGLFQIIDKYFIVEMHWLFNLFGDKDFLPTNWMTKMFGKWVCGWSYTTALCDNVLFQISGPESNQLNLTRVGVYTTHSPAGTSVANIIHWSQMVRSGNVQMYDYGTALANQQHYGQPVPPLYDLSVIDTPIYLYHSDKDWLADTEDIKDHLLDILKNETVKYRKPLVDFNHMDFIWGMRAPKEIYHPIINIMLDHENNMRHRKLKPIRLNKTV